MNQWLKWVLRGVCLLIFPLVFTGIVSHSETHVELEYCKYFVPYQGGFAGIEEDEGISTLFWIDAQGTLQETMRVLNMDVATQCVKSCDQLIQDENGTLYVACTLYDKDGETEKIIYRVDFGWEGLVPVWEIPMEELEGSFLSGQMFRIQQDKVYFTLYLGETSQLITYALDEAGELRDVNRVAVQGSQPERCIYTPEGLVALYRDQGIFLQEEKVYPTDGEGPILLNALGYASGQVSWLDFYQKQSVSISLSEGTINKHPIIGEVDFSKLERVYPMEDGSFSACLEQNGALIACYWDGEVLHYYTSLQGPFQWGMGAGYFLLALGAELLVVAVVWVVWFRKRKDRQREKRRFISVRTRISVISLLVTAVGTVGILWVSAVVIEQYSQEREQTSSANAAQTFMSLIGSGWKLQAGEEGFLTLPTDVSQSLDAWVEEQQKQGLPYSYEVFSYQNDRWYCIYSADLAGYAPAEYVVGEGVQQSFARAMDTGLIQSVEERRSIGTLQYSINYGTYAVSATQTHGLAVAAVSNGYEQKASILSSVVQLLVVVVVASLVLLLAENALVWMFMHRLRLLNRALARSAETEKWEIADFSGHDEVAETAQTMKTMTGNIQVYMKDIRTCNIQYDRLIPKDVIHLMGASSFTQVQAGQMAQRDVLLFTLVLVPDREVSATQLLESALKSVREQEGMVLDFQECQLTGCFLKVEQALAAFQVFLHHPDLKHRVTLLFSPATLQVGVTGDDAVKRVLILSEEERQLQELRERFVKGDCLGYFLHMETSEIDTWMHGFSWRLGGWLEGAAFYELIPKWGQSPKYAGRERFEHALMEYQAGNDASAEEMFHAICQENSGDSLAAWYWLECRKRLEGEKP